MPNDNSNYSRRRPQYGSVDGFARRPAPKDYPHVTRLNGLDGFSKPPAPSAKMSTMAAKPKPGQPYRPGQQTSAIFNTTLPNDLSHMSRQPSTKKNKAKKRSWKRVVLRSSLAVLTIGIIVGGWLGFRIVGSLDKLFHGNVVSDAQALFSNIELNGESSGRINILVAGDSADRVDPSANGGELTDSIMVLSIDTKNNTAFMLSIPRDLWVNVPNAGWSKINATYENNNMTVMGNLVHEDLGIPIDYYALTNYQAFEDLVNAVGGIKVDIQSPDPRGLYDPQPYPGATAFHLPNGWQSLNGTQALNLARARGEAYGSYGFPDSDFDRTEHQRQMVVAIAQKAKTLGVVSNPIRISQIFSALSSNIQTNLKLNDAITLAKLTKNIKIANIKSYAYCATLTPGCSPTVLESQEIDGQDVMAPTAGIGDYAQLQYFYQQITSNNPITQEGATVEILNGSNVDGLAKQEATTLTNEGFDVVGIGDPNNVYLDSMIIDQSDGKDPVAKTALQKVFSSDTTTTTSTTAPLEATEAQGYSADFVVVMGQNWDNGNSSSTN